MRDKGSIIYGVHYSYLICLIENKNQDTNVLVGSKKERLDIKAGLSNSFGFGGHNSSIIFAPFK